MKELARSQSCWKRVWLVGFVFALASRCASGGDGRMRLLLEIGYELSTDASFRDVNCRIKTPTPLYGCGYRAAGDFGGSMIVGAGVAYELSPWLTTDLRVGYHPQLEFEGQSDFLTPPAPEPVHGKVKALAAIVGVQVDFSELTGWRFFALEPYAGGGFGVSRNKVDQIVMWYPTLAVPHTMTTPGGVRSDFAFDLRAGISRQLHEKWMLQVEYRYADLGEVNTDAGDAIRYRPTTNETKVIPIGATRAELRTQAVVLLLSRAF
ncbi:MAG: outer membrane beta-barrel protein [Acidobacteriota bacterium]